MDRQIWMMLELLPRLNLVLLKSPVAGTMPPLFVIFVIDIYTIPFGSNII